MSRTWLSFKIIYIYFAVVFTTPCIRLVIFIIHLHLIMHFQQMNTLSMFTVQQKGSYKNYILKGLIQHAATMNILMKNLRNVQVWMILLHFRCILNLFLYLCTYIPIGLHFRFYVEFAIFAYPVQYISMPCSSSLTWTSATRKTSFPQV